MTIFSFFEDNVINCFCTGFESSKKKQEKEQHRLHQRMRSIGHKYNIAILPVISDYEFENLYPETNQVHQWNILIVGSDKTYIHASIYDLEIPEAESLLNNKGANVLGKELNEFFEPVFDSTLEGNRLQFFIIWRKTTYLVNTYPLLNNCDRVVGAIMFIRAYELLPKMSLDMSPKNSSAALNNTQPNPKRSTPPNTH